MKFESVLISNLIIEPKLKYALTAKQKAILKLFKLSEKGIDREIANMSEKICQS